MQQEQIENTLPKKRTWKRSLVTFLIVLVLIPATLFIGWKIGDRNYYIISLLVILYTMIPFFLMFEHRKPKARELTVLAVLCAIAVASRAAFIALPHFKPMTAIVIIAGITFGSQAGFMCGAVSGFVSNFIFGQGPWTPWQMFAYGVAGFLAGFLYEKGLLKKNKLPLCIFGGATVMLGVGPLLDLCALFTQASVVSWQQYGVLLLSGLPVNAVHASATILGLWFFSNPMFEKLDRIKIKYGLLED